MMRPYQVAIYNAICQKRDWGGNNVVVRTDGNVTSIYYYGNKIGHVDHSKKKFNCNNCGFKNASTTARINAIKMACDDLCYKEA